MESGTMSPTTGLSAGTPATNSTQYSSDGEQEIGAGPASSTAMRCQTGLRLYAAAPVAGDGAFTLVEQLDVTAERNGGNHVLDAIACRARAPQRLAEADREAQHADAEPARHPEMTELVHRDEHADRDDERGNRDVNPAAVGRNHAHCLFPAASSRLRLAARPAIGSRTSCNEPPPGCTRQDRSISAGCPGNRAAFEETRRRRLRWRR